MLITRIYTGDDGQSQTLRVIRTTAAVLDDKLPIVLEFQS